MNTTNLTALAKFLREVVDPNRFDMSDYLSHGTIHGPRNIKHDCGTAGCAMGWAPSLFPPTKGENWVSFTERVFDIEAFSDEWKWMFGPVWASTDNTPEGAADRIITLITTGLPTDWREQMYA